MMRSKRSIAVGLWPAGICQAAAYEAPRVADGKPNLNGIWQTLNTANWDIQGHAAQSGPVVALGAAGAVPAGPGVLEGDEIPYKPDAARKKKENFADRLTANPEIKCYVYAVSVSDLQTSKYILMAY